jgi:hypothetical protein
MMMEEFRFARPAAWIDDDGLYKRIEARLVVKVAAGVAALLVSAAAVADFSVSESSLRSELESRSIAGANPSSAGRSVDEIRADIHALRDRIRNGVPSRFSKESMALARDIARSVEASDEPTTEDWAAKLAAKFIL